MILSPIKLVYFNLNYWIIDFLPSVVAKYCTTNILGPKSIVKIGHIIWFCPFSLANLKEQYAANIKIAYTTINDIWLPPKYLI